MLVMMKGNESDTWRFEFIYNCTNALYTFLFEERLGGGGAKSFLIIPKLILVSFNLIILITILSNHSLEQTFFFKFKFRY